MNLTKEKYAVYSVWEKKLAEDDLALFQVNSRLVSLDDNCIGCPEDFHELELHKRLHQGLLPNTTGRLDKTGLRNGHCYNRPPTETLLIEKPREKLEFDDKHYARHIQEGFMHIGVSHLEEKF
jgi:hypothetical protein